MNENNHPKYKVDFPSLHRLCSSPGSVDFGVVGDNSNRGGEDNAPIIT